MMITCKNCNHRFEGNFCNSCGQSSHTHDINLHYIAHEIQHGIIHVDRGFFFTIRELFTRPGNSIREYIEGKRVDHFKPLAFLLILSTIYAFLSHTLGDNSFLENFITGFRSVPDNKGSKVSYVAVDWMLTHYAYTNLLLIPVSSLASYIAFKKSKYNYFQHIVLNAFVSGQTTLFYTVYIFVTYFIGKNKHEYILDYVEIIIGFLLTLWTYSQFFDSVKTWQKIVLTIINYILFIVFASLSFLIVFFVSNKLM